MSKQTIQMELDATNALRAAGAAPAAKVPESTVEAVVKALRSAWQLGQIYWQQADSEFCSQHKKADETRDKFTALITETKAMLEAAPKEANHD